MALLWRFADAGLRILLFCLPYHLQFPLQPCQYRKKARLSPVRQAGAGADALVTSHTLVALYDRIFLLGPSFMPAIDDLLLGFLLYKSRLVPRALSLIGIVGAPILIVGYLAILFGVIGQDAPLRALAALPVFVFELSLGIWLIVKGFNPSAANELLGAE
jgi:hypothetical protein